MADNNSLNRTIIRKSYERAMAASAQVLVPEAPVTVAQMRAQEAIYVAEVTDQTFYTGKGSNPSSRMANVTRYSDPLRFKGPRDANGMPDIGDISFDDDELDTQMDVNPHPSTGLPLKGRTWTSFDNSWRVSN